LGTIVLTDRNVKQLIVKKLLNEFALKRFNFLVRKVDM